MESEAAKAGGREGAPPSTGGSRLTDDGWIPTRARALRIALTYALVGATWIVTSGWLLHHLVPDAAAAAFLEGLKGWLFVGVTATLLAAVLDRYFARVRRAAQALEVSERRLGIVADNLPDSYVYQFTRDPDGAARFTYVSAGVLRVHGVSASEVLRDAGAVFRQFDADAMRDYAAAEAASTRALSEFTFDFTIARPDGERRQLQARSCPRADEAGGQVHWDGFVVDVTEKRRLEAEFQQAQKMEAVGRLAGGVAHDFNNILTSIIMQAELTAMEADVPESLLDGLVQIREDAERASSLTRQLLLFSRRQIMRSRVLDLNDVVQNLAKMLQRIIGEDVRLELDLGEGPFFTHADPGMLEQILMNLCVNARDAMPKGGPLTLATMTCTVDEALARACPDARLAGAYVGVSVRDEGTGIPADVLTRMFEPFFTTKDAGRGTGLGLATTFGIVKQHRGFIDVETELGRGSTFRVYLPAREGADEPEAPRQARRGGSETILLAEDEAPVRIVLTRVLERRGYRVIAAATGVEALALFAEHKDAVALLLTDLVMPAGLGGKELAERILAERPGLKVVYMSGYSAEIAGRELALLPTERFVQKPVRPDELLGAIRASLDGGAS